MQQIIFSSPGEVKADCLEVVTLSKSDQCIDVWPGDVILVTLWNDVVYGGKAVWSIDRGYIGLEYKERSSYSIAPWCIKSIEILKFSESRPAFYKKEDASD